MRFFAIIFGLLLLVSVIGIQESFASYCTKSKDWPMKPCFNSFHVDETDFIEGWAGYYEYKGAEFMEGKKIEMYRALENGIFKEWVYASENGENFNVYQYYLSTRDISEQFPYASYMGNVGDGPIDFYIFKEDQSSTTKLNPSLSILSPLKQFNNGINPLDVICKEGKQLIFKPNNSPACVKPSTAEKLIERGWTTLIDLENKSYIINECKNNDGRWINGYNECEDITRNMCEKLDGEFNNCTSGCRHSPDPSVVCAQVCIRVCDFN